MEPKPLFKITREKHLDHMVKVVPLIVLGYAIQSYFLLKMNKELGMPSVFILGGCLIGMIAGFIIYDTKHKVEFFEDHFEVNFLFIKKKISYSEIHGVIVASPDQSFSKIKFITGKKTYKFFFIDDAEKLKAFLEEDKTASSRKAA